MEEKNRTVKNSNNNNKKRQGVLGVNRRHNEQKQFHSHPYVKNKAGETEYYYSEFI